ncbi:hypothetical protein Dsin_005100 [Dipteronia sinensis]|uniref:Uncharacterized protein n=1 Tax=Dipteronia sinensis TaxID=43782 RepID=A0AAE0AVZ9_9ROSI|nr:hypothetical protein Dsin_005100 [Dipteronia sinensis]
MDRRTFAVLCELLRGNRRLKIDGLVSIEEQVCMFLHILAYHVKKVLFIIGFNDLERQLVGTVILKIGHRFLYNTWIGQSGVSRSKGPERGLAIRVAVLPRLRYRGPDVEDWVFDLYKLG